MFGIGFVILFLIGGIFLTGDTPMRDDSIEDIRKFFADDGEMYLLGDYLTGIAFIFLFLPYLVTLRWVLGSGEGWPPIWSWLTVLGGVSMLVIGGTAAVASLARLRFRRAIRRLSMMRGYVFSWR